MAITIDRIVAAKKDQGTIMVICVLADGLEKRITRLGGLTDDNSAARAAILARGQELFDKGIPLEGEPQNISSAVTTFLDNLPNFATVEAAIDNISSLAEAKPVLKKMAKAILALKETII